MWSLASISVALSVIGTCTLTLVWYLKSLFATQDTLPHLHYRDSALTKHLLERCAAFRRPFSPSFWITSPHLQTIMAAVLPQRRAHYSREYLQTNDRGVVALDWLISVNYHLRKSSNILVVFPGLTGSAVSVSNLCVLAAQRGFEQVAIYGASTTEPPVMTLKFGKLLIDVLFHNFSVQKEGLTDYMIKIARRETFSDGKLSLPVRTENKGTRLVATD
jgi:hypothetical protein